MNVHSKAHTTPKIREEIRASKGHITVDDWLMVVREFLYDKMIRNLTAFLSGLSAAIYCQICLAG